MWIVIRPDHYGREPTIDFYEDGEIDTSPYKDFVIKEFHNIIELKSILLQPFTPFTDEERLKDVNIVYCRKFYILLRAL